MTADSSIDERALNSLSIAPTADAERTSGQNDAGQDKSIARRLEKNPDSKDAKLDNALDESMDASDPVATTHAGNGDPAPSSGYDEKAERQRDA